MKKNQPTELREQKSLQKFRKTFINTPKSSSYDANPKGNKIQTKFKNAYRLTRATLREQNEEKKLEIKFWLREFLPPSHFFFRLRRRRKLFRDAWDEREQLYCISMMKFPRRIKTRQRQGGGERSWRIMMFTFHLSEGKFFFVSLHGTGNLLYHINYTWKWDSAPQIDVAEQFNALMNKIKDRKSMPTFVSRYRVLLVYLFGSFTSLLSSNPSLGKLIIPSTLFAEEQRGKKTFSTRKCSRDFFR